MSNTELFFVGIFTRNQQHTIIYVASDEFSQQERESMQSDVTLIVYNDFTHVDNVAATAIKWLKDITNSHFKRWDRVNFYESSLHASITSIRVSRLSIAEIKEKGLLHSKELDLVEFDMNKARSATQPPVTHDPGLFTAEQRAYVDSVGNDVEALRSQLLHQVRLRDIASANATFLERESNHASQVAIKLRSILEQLIAENPKSKLVKSKVDELRELRVNVVSSEDDNLFATNVASEAFHAACTKIDADDHHYDCVVYPEDMEYLRRCLRDIGIVASQRDIYVFWSEYSDDFCANFLMCECCPTGDKLRVVVDQFISGERPFGSIDD